MISSKSTSFNGRCSALNCCIIVFASFVVNFGNVCLGAGGGHSIGYWTNKNGEETLYDIGMEDMLWWLRYMSLRNADGSNFDPYTYAELRTWLRGANSKNMLYMLSAQMVAMTMDYYSGFKFSSFQRYLNDGKISTRSLIKTPSLPLRKSFRHLLA